MPISARLIVVACVWAVTLGTLVIALWALLQALSDRRRLRRSGSYKGALRTVVFQGVRHEVIGLAVATVLAAAVFAVADRIGEPLNTVDNLMLAVRNLGLVVAMLLLALNNGWDLWGQRRAQAEIRRESVLNYR